MKLTEKQIDAALEFLRANADEAAIARAEVRYLDEFRKSKKAILMSLHSNLPVSAQEREAYADKEYQELLDAYKEAVRRDAYFTFKREAANAVIEAWRTQQANLRAEGKAY